MTNRNRYTTETGHDDPWHYDVNRAGTLATVYEDGIAVAEFCNEAQAKRYLRRLRARRADNLPREERS